MFKLLRMARCCTPAVFDGLIDLFRFAKNTGCDVAEQSIRPPELGFEFRTVLLNCRKHFSHISPEPIGEPVLIPFDFQHRQLRLARWILVHHPMKNWHSAGSASVSLVNVLPSPQPSTPAESASSAGCDDDVAD